MEFLSPPIWVTSIVLLLITLLITTHEPPSRPKPDLSPSQSPKAVSGTSPAREGATRIHFRNTVRVLRSPWIRSCIPDAEADSFEGVLGGSWVVINGVISRVTILTTHIRGLITPLITTHEPPSRV